MGSGPSIKVHCFEHKVAFSIFLFQVILKKNASRAINKSKAVSCATREFNKMSPVSFFFFFANMKSIVYVSTDRIVIPRK